MKYVVLCECAEGSDRRIIAWINDLRPAQKHVSITGTSGFKVTRRGHRTKAGSERRYIMTCADDCKGSLEISEPQATALIDLFKPTAEQLETVIVPNPPDAGIRPGWHATSDGPEARRVLGFQALQKINSDPKWAWILRGV